MRRGWLRFFFRGDDNISYFPGRRKTGQASSFSLCKLLTFGNATTTSRETTRRDETRHDKARGTRRNGETRGGRTKHHGPWAISHGQPASTARRRREREKERKGREEREIVLNRRGAWLILGIWDLDLTQEHYPDNTKLNRLIGGLPSNNWS